MGKNPENLGHWNKKVAKSRGARWHKNMLEGRIKAELHPSKLRMARLSKGLMQNDVAKVLGLTRPTYAAVEKGSRGIKANMLKKIEKYFGRTGLFTMMDGKFFAAQDH